MAARRTGSSKRQVRHSPIDDTLTELTTTRDGRFFCGVGPRAAEGPQAPVAAHQEIKGPASGGTYLKRARRDGEALVTHFDLLARLPGESVSDPARARFILALF